MTTNQNRPKQNETFQFRLHMEAAMLRKQAEGMPPGIRRDELLQKARQADTALYLNQWLASPFCNHEAEVSLRRDRRYGASNETQR